jgi:hypothetical protein
MQPGEWSAFVAWQALLRYNTAVEHMVFAA